MDWRDKRINDELKKHDPLLFIKSDHNGIRHVMRKNTKVKEYDLGDNYKMLVYEPSPEYIMSLTKDWTMRGESVEWGLEPIAQRLRDIDSWNPNSIANQFFKHNEKVDDKKAKRRDDNMEDLAREYLPVLKRHFKDTNTSQMDMKKDPRRKGDRKYGNRK